MNNTTAHDFASPDLASPEPAPAFSLVSIGTVRNEIQEPEYINWGSVVSEIVIVPEHVTALGGLEKYSHLMVLFWMHQVCYTKEVHVPQGKHGEVPEVGIFACRCPYRPNPIGCTTVPIIDIRDNVIVVKGLDAVNQTPIIDIKPYTPQYDFICELDAEIKKKLCKSVRVPDWIFRLTY